MLLEAAWTSRPVSPGLFAAGAVMFVLAKALKWAAVAALGPAWTFRVIVVPGAPLVEGGPYRYVRHPNYVGVLGEIAGVALMTGAMVSGPLSLVVFGAILARRLIVEGRALSLAGAVPADERP
jgi:methyltransferase